MASEYQYSSEVKDGATNTIIDAPNIELSIHNEKNETHNKNIVATSLAGNYFASDNKDTSDNIAQIRRQSDY